MKPAKLIALIIALGFVLSASCALAAEKIGVIDVRKCIQLTDLGKKTYKELKGEVDRIQGDLDVKEKEIEGIRTKLEKGVGVLSDSAKMKLESDLRRLSRSYRDMYEESQARIRQLEMERTRPILDKIFAVVKEFGKKNGYSLIQDVAAGVHYYDPKNDITNQIIKEFNAKHPVKGK